MRTDVRAPASVVAIGKARVAWPWLALVAGLFLVQTAWIILIPPFDGQDEHDHAFKAAAVARGDWGGEHDRVAVGRGAQMAVPGDIVAAALPACEALPYTQRDDCHPSATLSGGEVLVGTSFAPTHPAFYSIVGAVALPFEGVAAGYAMRLGGALLCTAMIVTAAAVLRRTSRTRWPAAALLLSLTPALVYATSLPAPNGLEMTAGLLLWCTLLFGSTDSSPAPRWVVTAGTVAAVVLATVRTIGPLWLSLCLLVAVLYHGVPWARAHLRRRSLWPAHAVTLIAVLASAAWTLAYSPNDPANESGPAVPGSPWPRIPSAWVVWLLQQVAAMPRRSDMVPASVYAVVLAAWVVALWLALRHGGRAVVPVLAIFATTTVISIALTVATYSEIALAWQGRYAWPFVLGWLLITAHSLEQRRVANDGRALALVAATAAFSLSVTIVGVRHKFVTGGAAGDPTWSAPPVWSLVLLTLLGVLLLVAAATRLHVARPPRDDDSADGSFPLRVAAGAP